MHAYRSRIHKDSIILNSTFKRAQLLTLVQESCLLVYLELAHENLLTNSDWKVSYSHAA